MSDPASDLYSALDAAMSEQKSGGCGGCPDTSTGVFPTDDPFASIALTAINDSEDFLNTALNTLELNGTLDGSWLSGLDGLEFADLGQESAITLQEILSLAEQNPGLKISLSY